MHTPRYFDEFSCRASACPDSCCRAGWEIPIDDDTFAFYKSVRIDIESTTYTDPDGERAFKLRKDKSCPHFRADGLCDIYLKTDGRLCDICAKYPRFFEEYDGFSEAGLSISCPTAAEIMLSRAENPYIDLKRRSPDHLLEFLANARSRAMKMIYDEPNPDTAAAKLLGFGIDLQELIDFDELEALEGSYFLPEELFGGEALSRVKDYILTETDIMTPRWRELLAEDFGGGAGTSFERRNYLAYLIYRYFLKAINYENTLMSCGFIVIMYQLAGGLCSDYTEAVRLISKEIEHDAENVHKMMELAAEILDG